MFGDFFSYIAMAWLVLQLTRSSLALGSVLVVQAVPRGVLMLVGGAISDRLSPRVTMLASMGLRVALVAPLAVLVLSGRVQMWEVYGISFVFGVVDAFFLPARSSILPSLVADKWLEASNAVINISSQVSVVIGPPLAGTGCGRRRHRLGVRGRRCMLRTRRAVRAPASSPHPRKDRRIF